MHRRVIARTPSQSDKYYLYKSNTYLDSMSFLSALKLAM